MGALYSNTTGNYNTAVGKDAMFCNTIGNCNTAYGNDALYNSTSSLWNTAVGYRASYSTVYTWYNTSVGMCALYSATIDADRNTAIGYEALKGTTTGRCNTGLGMGGGCGITTACNTISVGHYTQPSNTNGHTVWGNSSNNVYNCVYTSWSNVSDCRDKTDIVPLNSCYGVSFIKKLSPVSYKWDNRETYVRKCNYTYGQKDGRLKSEKCHYGFLAQDIKTSIEELNITFDALGHDPNKDAYRLTYEELIAPLVKAVQELTERVEILENSAQ
jgi:hypothetical protein